jgi:hypothetical protein
MVLLTITNMFLDLGFFDNYSRKAHSLGVMQTTARVHSYSDRSVNSYNTNG